MAARALAARLLSAALVGSGALALCLLAASDYRVATRGALAVLVVAAVAPHAERLLAGE